MMENPLKVEFLQHIESLDKTELLWLADEAIGAANEVIRQLKLNDGGDAFDYHGSMNAVELARDHVEAYRDYLILHGYNDE